MKKKIVAFIWILGVDLFWLFVTFSCSFIFHFKRINTVNGTVRCLEFSQTKIYIDNDKSGCWCVCVCVCLWVLSHAPRMLQTKCVFKRKLHKHNQNNKPDFMLFVACKTESLYLLFNIEKFERKTSIKKCQYLLLNTTQRLPLFFFSPYCSERLNFDSFAVTSFVFWFSTDASNKEKKISLKFKQTMYISNEPREPDCTTTTTKIEAKEKSLYHSSTPVWWYLPLVQSVYCCEI